MYFTILLVVTEFCVILYLFLKLTTSKQKIHLQNQGGIGLPLGAMKFVETEDAGISLGPDLVFPNILEGKKSIFSCLIVREAYKENIKKNDILEFYS